MEWFQNTQTGLVRSRVSSSANCTRTGLCRGLGSGAPSLYTTALTTGVLMTGRPGSLQGERVTGTRVSGNMSNSPAACKHRGHGTDALGRGATPAASSAPGRGLGRGCGVLRAGFAMRGACTGSKVNLKMVSARLAQLHMNQEVPGSIPDQGTGPGHGSIPSVGAADP